MNDDRDISRAFVTAEEYSTVETFAASSYDVSKGSHRLEGGFYGSCGYRALRAMRHSGLRMTTVGQLADVVWPKMFRRIYVDDQSAGVLFLSTSDMSLARLDSHAYISKRLTPSLDSLLVEPGTLLISRSGTIGNTVLVRSDFQEAAVSEDALRVRVHNSADRGLVFVFLLSEAGQFLLTRNKSGSVVEHIYEADVSQLPIPFVPQKLREEMTRLVDKAAELRVRANALLNDAEHEVQRACYLPELSDLKPKNLLPKGGAATLFTERSTHRFGAPGFGEIRFDATYHEPVAIALARYILAQREGTRLGTLLRAVRNSTLRKRVYVEDSQAGVPLIGGKQLMQWRPHGVKHLSRLLTRNLKNEVLENGWTLVSCGGTLGRCLFVHRNYEGYAASQHVMRIIPDTSEVYPGFIYAFLSSPYGQVQIQQRAYGSVIPELRDFQFGSIAIRRPKDRGEAIHSKVVEAFDARADAKQLEDEASGLLQMAIERGREYVESEWGTEY